MLGVYRQFNNSKNNQCKNKPSTFLTSKRFCSQSIKHRFCKKKKKKKASFCVIQNQAGPSPTLQESHANADNCLKFISLLSGPCQELANSEPGTIPKLLPRLLNIVRVIWMNSEHYHSRERLNGLLRKVRVLKFVTCSVKFSQNFGLQAHEGLKKGLEARNVLASYPGSFT